MEQPLVSIIMGAYNEENTIAKCIESIMHQTYKSWEFIICNDCSKDRTREMIESFCQQDKRIILLNNEKNMRLAASLNRCLETAKGKYIARMDADDESMPERLEKQVHYLESHPDVDCVGCNRLIFDENGNIGIRKSVKYPSRDILKRDTPFAHPTIMMKKTVYEKLGGYTVSKHTMRAEDLDLWIRFFAHSFKGYNIQEVLYCYRESLGDLKKRSLKAAIETSKVYIRGYKILGFSLASYVYALKPVVSALIPDFIMKHYYKKRLM